MSVHPLHPQQDPLRAPVTAVSRQLTDCLDLLLQLTLLPAGERSDMAWLLDSRLADLELAVRGLRPVLEQMKWTELREAS